MKQKILNKTRTKKLKKLIFSKSFLGSFIFAIGLWGYTSLNLVYVTYVQVPLVVNLPLNRAKENEIPTALTLKVRGTGWHLFYLLFFNTTAKCYIDLSKYSINTDKYQLYRSDLIKSVIDLVNVEAIDVLPESLSMTTGAKIKKKVPIIPNIIANTRADFCKVGNIKLVPDSIVIWGNRKVINNIKEWRTEPLVLNDLHSKLVIPINLEDTLKSRVELSEKTIKASVDVEQISEITFRNIPVNVLGGSIKQNQLLMPSQVTITVRGGIDVISKITDDNIYVNIFYVDILKDTIGILKPQVFLPADVKLVKIDPPYIYHIIREPLNKSSLSDIHLSE